MAFKKNIMIVSVLTFCLGIAFSISIDIGSLAAQEGEGTASIELLALNNYDIFLMILKNNVVVICINFLGGLTLGLITFLNTFYNGFVLGLLVQNALTSFSGAFIFSSLAPHSIEFAGIVLSCYAGYLVAIQFYRYCFLSKSPRSNEIKQLLVMVAICGLTILLAAFLEAYVTIEQ